LRFGGVVWVEEVDVCVEVGGGRTRGCAGVAVSTWQEDGFPGCNLLSRRRGFRLVANLWGLAAERGCNVLEVEESCMGVEIWILSGS